MSAALPLVTIVTPVYNGAKFIEDLILSVKSQDYPQVEHIVVDDGSDDNGETVRILKKYSHLRWWSQRNQGQYAAMNEGLLAAKGDLVCFISSDDILLPDAITAAIQFFRLHPEMDGGFGLTGYMDEQGLPLFPPSLFPTAPFRFVGYFAHVSHCSLYLKRERLMQSELLFDPSLKYTGDYDWMIRIVDAPMKIGRIKQKLSLIRLHSSQTSQLYVSAGLEEIERVYKRHAINIALRRLVLFFHFFYYRFWEMGEKYRMGGLRALAGHIVGFIRRRVQV